MWTYSVSIFDDVLVLDVLVQLVRSDSQFGGHTPLRVGLEAGGQSLGVLNLKIMQGLVSKASQNGKLITYLPVSKSREVAYNVNVLAHLGLGLGQRKGNVHLLIGIQMVLFFKLSQI